jgi:hypothetical protein
LSAVASIPETLVEQLVREGLISMSGAARVYGQSRDGVMTHRGTPARHALQGVRLSDGRLLKLESVRINGQLRTSKAAVLRFFESQNDSDAIPCDVPTQTRSARAAADASRELDEALRHSQHGTAAT